MTSKFLIEKYLEKIISNAKWSVKGFREHERRDVKVSVSRLQFYRAKTKALEMV